MIYKKFVKFLKRFFKKRRKPARKRQRHSRIRNSNRKKIKNVPRPAKKKNKSKKYRSQSKIKKDLKRNENFILAGVVMHYFPKINVAVVKLKKTLCIGMPIFIKGKKTDFRQTIGSMQANHKPIEKASRGQDIGLEVFRPVVSGDSIYEVKTK